MPIEENTSDAEWICERNERLEVTAETVMGSIVASLDGKKSRAEIGTKC